MSEIEKGLMDWPHIEQVALDESQVLDGRVAARCLCDLQERIAEGFEAAARRLLDVEAITGILGERLRKIEERVEHLENGKAAHLIRHREITDLAGWLSAIIQVLEQWRDAYPMTATEIRRKMSERIEPVLDTPHEQIIAKLDRIIEIVRDLELSQ